MKRDLDLIRDILLDIEAHVKLHPEVHGYTYEHADQDAVEYALYLMCDYGLISAEPFHESGATNFMYGGVIIRWGGQEFLDSVRDGEIWKKISICSR